MSGFDIRLVFTKEFTEVYGQFEFEPDQPLVPALVMHGKYRPNPILCQVSLNFDDVPRLLQYPAYHRLSPLTFFDKQKGNINKVKGNGAGLV